MWYTLDIYRVMALKIFLNSLASLTRVCVHRKNVYHLARRKCDMGRIRQPTSYFGGGFTIDGDISLDGDINLSPVRIGEGAVSLESTLVIGDNADATGSNSTAVGNNARALSQNTTAFGQDAKADGVDATALGKEALAPNNWNTVIGFQAGSVSNGANIVLIGRKSKGEGDDVVAIGENAIANGDRSTVVGKATEVTADNASAFGQGSTVQGIGATVVGQDVDVEDDYATAVGTNLTASAPGATAVGRGSVATAEDSTAVGRGAEANGVNSLAIGKGSVVNQDDTYSFGDRNIRLPIGKSFLYPENPGPQSIVNIPITDDANDGDPQGYSFDIAGNSIIEIAAEADGAGGIKNEVARIRASFDLRGGGDDIADIITGNISIRDSEGDEKFRLDATQDPPIIDLHNNRVNNFGLRLGESITYEPDAGAQRLANINLDGASENAEESLSLGINEVDIFKAYAESDGTGAIKNEQFRLIQKANLNGNDLVDDTYGTVIWDSVNNYINQDALQNSTLAYNAGGGLTGGGTVALGSSATFNIGAGNFITVNSDDIEVNIGSGLEPDGSDNIRLNGGSIADGFLSEGSNPHQLSVNIGSGLTGSSNDIIVDGSEIAGTYVSQGSSTHKISVNIGRGLTGSSGNIIIDEDTEFDFQNIITFRSGIDTRGDITDGTVTIWDDSEQYINQDALQNDSVTINSGHGLKNGSTVALGSAFTLDVEPADFAGSFISDEGSDLLGVNIGSGIEGDGSDNIRVSGGSIADTFLSEGSSPHQLQVNIARGLEGDGAGSIQVDESTDFTFTSRIDFDSGLLLNSGQGIVYPENSGVETLADIPVTSSVSSGVEESYTFDIGGQAITKVYGESDGSGSVQNTQLRSLVDFNLTGNDIVDGETIIWNSTGGYIEQSVLENSQITLNAGNGLKNGSTAALGGSFSLDIEPGDIVGSYISESSDIINVNIGRGLEGDGSDNIQIDESTDFTFASVIDFSSGLNTLDDIVDDTGQVIWDSSEQEIPDSALGSIANATLQNSEITVSAGNGLTSGGVVSLGDSTTINIATDGVKLDELDQTISPTWTGAHEFDAGINMGSQINMGANGSGYKIVNLPDPANPLEAANKRYVDGVASGLNLKRSCNAASQGNIDLTSSTDPNPIDGVTLSDGDRVLLKNQSDATENGIYVANTATDPSTWSRSEDFNEDDEVTSGSFTFIKSGTENDGTSFVVTTEDPITVGSTDINFDQFSQAGEFNGGNGIIIDGQTLSVDVSGLSGSGIEPDGSGNAFRIASGIAGDGIDGGSGSPLSIAVNEFAGSGLQDDGSDNLELVNDSVSLTAGDGLSGGGSVSLGSGVSIEINPSDFAGTFLSASGSDLSVDVGEGLENDGSDNIRVDEDKSFTFTSAIDFSSGLDVSSNITDGAQTIWDSANQEVPDSALGTVSHTILDLNTITVNAGNALTGGGETTLGDSVDIAVDSIANSDLTNSSLTLNAGDGVSIDNSTLTLGSTRSLSITPSDFAGTFISTDGSSNLTVNIGSGLTNSSGNIAVDESTDFTFTSTLDFNAGLDTAGDITDNGNGVKIWDSANGEIPDSAMGSIDNATLSNSSITINSGNGLTGGSTSSLGGSLTLGIETSGVGTDELNTPFASLSTLVGSPVSVGAQLNLAADLLGSDGSTTIWDSTNNHIPTGALQFTDVTISGSNGLSGGTTSLGGTVTVGISGVLQLDGDLQSPGGTVVWDDSNSWIPTSVLEANQVTVAGNTVSLGGSVNVSLSDLSAFDLSGNSLSDSGTTIWDSASGYIPTDVLESDTVSLTTGTGIQGGGDFSLGGGGLSISLSHTEVSINGKDGLDGGTLSLLGGSVDVGITGALSLDADLEASDGTVLWDDSSGYIPQDVLQNDSVTVAGNTVGLGGSIDIALSNLSDFNLSGNSLSDSGTTIWDSASEYIPQSVLQNDSVTISAGNGVSLSTQVLPLGGSTTVSISSNAIQLDELDLSISPEWTSEHVFTGGANFNGSDITSVNTLNVSDITSNNGSDPITLTNAGWEFGDNIKNFFGSGGTFSQFYDFDNGDLVIRDEVNDVDLIRQPEQGPTQFIQGADIGSIETPEDSLVQVINAPVTSALGSGSRVGYTLALDNQSFIEVGAESDGSGGIQNAFVEVSQDIKDSGTTIWDSGSGYIPTSTLQSDIVSLSTGTGIAGGGDMSLGGGGLSISLEYTEVSINGNDGLSGGTLSLLGGSVDIGISGVLSLDTDLEASDGTVLWDDSNGYIPTSVLQDDSVTLSVDSNMTSSGSVALGSSFSLGLADPISLTRIDVDVIGDNGSSAIDFNIGGARRANMDSSGNLSIEGELTEGAAL